MPGYIDLHTHSTASDGSLSPQELVRLASASGLAAVALTDHDTIAGIPEALQEGEAAGIQVIPGVEISLDFKPEMHMLGFFTLEGYRKIEEQLDNLKKNRDERNPKIIKKLNELGFSITLEEVNEQVLGNIVGRPHIAMVMVKKGYVGSVEEAFDKFLAGGRPAYFKKDKLTPKEGVQLINSAGGIPVIAHPIYLGLDYHGLDDLFRELSEAGLKGIEAYYVDNRAEDTGMLLRLAIKHHLLVTGGSDFHGAFKKDIKLGVGRGNLKVPVELLEKLQMELSLKKEKPILSDGGR